MLRVFLIPIIALAIEPSNPVNLCERFVGDQEKADCLQKTSGTDLDWYAASMCSLQQEDNSFHLCLKEIEQASFNPEALKICAKDSESSDEQRLACIQKIKNRDFTQVQMKKCSETVKVDAATECFSKSFQTRQPASSKKSSGFQSVEIRK